ncbi:MAG: HmuY family protein [Porphyromonadaceae bacterium]|nr:HmuY family protein [Porphyromonadaceae bacterium]
MNKIKRLSAYFFAFALVTGVGTACKKKYMDGEDPIDKTQLQPTPPNTGGSNGSNTGNGTPNTGGNKPEETDPTTGEKIRSVTLDVSAYEKFVYFSFEKGSVSISDEQSEQYDGWDIAFHRTDIRTNSGTSSKIGAMGGAYETPEVLLTQKVTMPEANKFEVDERFVIAVYHTDEEGVRQDYRAANPVLTTRSKPRVDDKNEFIRGDNGFIIYDILQRGAIVMDRSRMPPTIEFSNKVYLVRTPKGKYAKIKIVDYKRKPGTPMGDPGRLLTMDYVYPVQ